MSSLPIRQKRLGLSKAEAPDYTMNDGFKGSPAKPKPLADYSDWEGTVKGKTKHTYKNGD